MDRRLGRPLPHQLPNPTRANPSAINLSPLRAYAALAAVSNGYSAPKGMFPRVTHPSAADPERSARLACIRPAASVRSEPGSNSQVQSTQHIYPKAHQLSPAHPKDTYTRLSFDRVAEYNHHKRIPYARSSHTQHHQPISSTHQSIPAHTTNPSDTQIRHTQRPHQSVKASPILTPATPQTNQQNRRPRIPSLSTIHSVIHPAPKKRCANSRRHRRIVVTTVLAAEPWGAAPSVSAVSTQAPGACQTENAPSLRILTTGRAKTRIILYQ